MLIGVYRPIKDACLFEHVAKIDICIEKGTVKFDGLLKIVDGKPNVTTLVVNAAKIGVGNGKVRIATDRLDVALLLKIM